MFGNGLIERVTGRGVPADISCLGAQNPRSSDSSSSTPRTADNFIYRGDTRRSCGELPELVTKFPYHRRLLDSPFLDFGLNNSFLSTVFLAVILRFRGVKYTGHIPGPELYPGHRDRALPAPGT